MKRAQQSQPLSLLLGEFKEGAVTGLPLHAHTGTVRAGEGAWLFGGFTWPLTDLKGTLGRDGIFLLWCLLVKRGYAEGIAHDALPPLTSVQ